MKGSLNLETGVQKRRMLAALRLFCVSGLLILLPVPVPGAVPRIFMQESFESLPAGIIRRPATLNSNLFCDTNPNGTAGLAIVKTNGVGGSQGLRVICHKGTDAMTGAVTDGRFIVVRANLPGGCDEFYMSFSLRIEPGSRWRDDRGSNSSMKVVWVNMTTDGFCASQPIVVQGSSSFWQMNDNASTVTNTHCNAGYLIRANSSSGTDGFNFIEVFFRNSTGVGKSFSNGVFRLKVNSQTVIYATNIVFQPRYAGAFKNVYFGHMFGGERSASNFVCTLDNLQLWDGWPTAAPEIEVTGNGMIIPNGDTSPNLSDFTDFQSTSLFGPSVTRPYTITNIGTAPLTPQNVVISGTNAADFAVTVPPQNSVAPGGRTTFTVAFVPRAVGPRTAQVSVVNNDSDENPYRFAVRGVGTTNSVTEIVDNSDSSNILQSGGWLPSQAYPGYFGPNYHYSPNAAGHWFQLTSRNLYPGTYEIYARWPAVPGRPSDVTYQITHHGGTSVVAGIDQRINGNIWNLLGRYNFKTNGTVRVVSGATGFEGTCADAVQFKRVSLPGPWLRSTFNNSTRELSLDWPFGVLQRSILVGPDASWSNVTNDGFYKMTLRTQEFFRVMLP